MTREALSFAISNGLSALVLAAVAWLAGRKLKSPALTHALWLLVLVKLVSPPLVDVPLPSLTFLQEPPAQSEAESNVKRSPRELLDILDGMHPAGRESMQESLSGMNEPIHARTHEPVKVALDPAPKLDAIQPDATHAAALSSSEFLCIVWATGTALWFTVAVYRIARFRKLLAKTQPAEAALHAEVEGLAQQIRLPRVPRVCIVNSTLPPLTWALWGQPVILLPRQLLNELTDAERHVLLAHELAHLIRRDHLARCLELLAVGINWWQPAAWIAQRQLHRTSEECCDAWVVRQFPQLARPYAEALLKTVDFLAATKPALPIGSTGFGEAHHLKRRFTMILSDHKTDRMTWLGRFTVLAISCIALPLSVQTLWAEIPEVSDKTSTQNNDFAGLETRDLPTEHATSPLVTDQTFDPRGPIADEAITHVANALFLKGRYVDAANYYLLRKDAAPEDLLRLFADKLDRIHSSPIANAQLDGSQTKKAAVSGKDEADDRLTRLESKVDKLVQLLDRAVGHGNSRRPKEDKKADRDELNPESIDAVIRDPDVYNALSKEQERRRQLPPSSPGTEFSVEKNELASLRNAQLEWSHLAADIARDVQINENNRNRVNAAEEHYKTAIAAHKGGTATFDLVLDAQRRKVEASNEYMESTARLAIALLTRSSSDKSAVLSSLRFLSLSKLVTLRIARNEALDNWKEIHALYRAGSKGGEADKEAQAREQFFFFRQQAEDALSGFLSADEKLKQHLKEFDQRLGTGKGTGKR